MNKKATLIVSIASFVLFFGFMITIAAAILSPIFVVVEAVNNIKETTSNFLEKMGNVFMLRGWCTNNECYEKEEKDYYIIVKDLYNKYDATPYNLKLNTPLIQATIFYAFDYDKLYNPNAINFTTGDKKTAGQFDYRAAKNQIYDLINNLVHSDNKGVYYQDIAKYDDYLRNTYISLNFPDLLKGGMTIEDIIKDIHARAGLEYYYQNIKINDNISGDIMDLLDAPFRGTECAITSGFNTLRNGRPHNATDVVGATNKNIYSVADGTVVAVEVHTENLYKYWDSTRTQCMCNGSSCPNGYGTYIIIEHTLNGQKYRSRYAHLSSTLVTAGQTVTKGQQIAVEGSTGCSTGSHLHFEFYSIDGHKFDPTSIMSRCATQSATIANCNLENITVKVCECTRAWAGPNSKVLEEVPFKDYVRGVMTEEISPERYDMQFMKAFAIAVQTYSLRRGGYNENSNYIYLRDCTYDQVYGKISDATKLEQERTLEAVDAVFGSVIMKDGKLMSASYKKNEAWGCGYQKNDMCQEGGNQLGKDGKTYKEILEYYYVNPTITNYCQNAADKAVPGINNSKSNITCGATNISDINAELQKLTTKVKNAGIGSRAGVVAAARYLALDFPSKIPYFTDDSDVKGRYYKIGINTDKDSGWGCPITKDGIPTTEKVTGGLYYNGLSDSGFVTWAMLNGGVKEVGNIGSDQLADRGRQVTFGDSQVSDGTVKIGDLFWDGGHIGIIIGIDNDNIYVAEEDTKSGLIVTTHAKSEKNDDYSYILMNGVYGTDGSISNMW